MSKFKDRLWRELVREHRADLAQMKRPAARPSRRPRVRVLAGTTAGVAGAATALALVLTAASSSPAFAVTPNRDGTVQVVIKRLSGIKGANIRLASLGIRARIVEVLPGCQAVAPSNRSLAQGVIVSGGVRAAVPAFAHIRLDPRRIPVGRTVVLPTMRAGHLIHIARADWVRGAAPACPPPPPVSLPPGVVSPVHCVVGPPVSGNSGNSGNSGASGNSGPPPTAVPNRALECRPKGPPPSGNSGNSGSTGNG